MERITMSVRKDWKKRCEEAGFGFHTIENEPYWREGACYRFTPQEIEAIEDATNELHAMCLEHVADTVARGAYEAYRFPPFVAELVEKSWKVGEPGYYGRFDLAYDGRRIKMLEYNADTPTSFPEASVWQWLWLQDHALPDQFNSIHEKAVARWKTILGAKRHRLHFTAMAHAGAEDWGNIHYHMAVADEAGFDTSAIDLEEIGWSESRRVFTDVKEEPIEILFKLYPWEWILGDEFGWKMATSGTRFLEPAWKLLLSTKALLPLLSEKHPNHPLLLPAYFDDPDSKPRSGAWARKPVLGREGSNLSLVSNGTTTQVAGSTFNSAYDTRGYVLQEWFNVPKFEPEAWSPVIGSWVVGDEAAGMGIREDRGVTGNASCFVPHYFA